MTSGDVRQSLTTAPPLPPSPPCRFASFATSFRGDEFYDITQQIAADRELPDASTAAPSR
jgi:hypothetical protein